VSSKPHPHSDRPQFPPGPEGQLAQFFIQEAIDGERRAEIVRLTEKLEELAALVREQQTQAIATAAAEAAAKTAEALVERLTGGTMPATTVVPPVPTHQWDIPEWNSYPGFRKWVVDRYKDGQSKRQVAELHGTSAKSITRAQVHYHLPARLWPPTLWPEKPPGGVKRRTVRSLKIGELRRLGGMLAAVLLSFGVLDAADGRLDGFVHFCLKQLAHNGHLIPRL